MKTDHNNQNSIASKARGLRAKLFGLAVEKVYLSSSNDMEGLSILDIGGTLEYWRMNARYLPANSVNSIEVVNLQHAAEVTELINGIEFIAYQGNALDRNTLKQKTYDVVFSNSVIEHVGSLSDQKYFADNVNSLASYHFIQTPCETFPIEPHFYFPFFALLPLGLRSWLYRNFRLGWMGRERDWLKSRILCEETRLLNKRELLSIFPESNMLSERLFFLVKSWMITNMANKTMQRTALHAAADHKR